MGVSRDTNVGGAVAEETFAQKMARWRALKAEAEQAGQRTEEICKAEIRESNETLASVLKGLDALSERRRKNGGLLSEEEVEKMAASDPASFQDYMIDIKADIRLRKALLDTAKEELTKQEGQILELARQRGLNVKSINDLSDQLTTIKAKTAQERRVVSPALIEIDSLVDALKIKKQRITDDRGEKKEARKDSSSSQSQKLKTGSNSEFTLNDSSLRSGSDEKFVKKSFNFSEQKRKINPDDFINLKLELKEPESHSKKENDSKEKKKGGCTIQ
jgi:hypothetical protein